MIYKLQVQTHAPCSGLLSSLFAGVPILTDLWALGGINKRMPVSFCHLHKSNTSNKCLKCWDKKETIITFQGQFGPGRNQFPSNKPGSGIQIKYIKPVTNKSGSHMHASWDYVLKRPKTYKIIQGVFQCHKGLHPSGSNLLHPYF